MSDVIRHARAAAADKPKTLDLSDLRALAETDPFPAEKNAAALEKIEQARLTLNLSYSTLASHLDHKCYYWIPTSQIPTAAVAASGNGYLVFLYNSEFIDSLVVEDVMYVILHEITHLFLRHLFAAPELRKDKTFEIANEVMCNHFCNTRLGRKKPPADAVDPKKVYADYSKDVATPVSFEKFVDNDYACYSELMRMTKPPGQSGKKHVTCVHQSGVIGDDHGDGQGVPADEQTTGQLVKEALESAMKDALKGNSTAREELLDLASITENGSEEAQKMWGDLGLGALRGETVKTRQVEWWQRWLKTVLGSRLKHGGKLVYPRKRAGILSLLGHDSPMLHRGPEKTKRVVRAIDTSGSMSQDFLNRFFKVTGATSGVEWIDLSFDAVVMPYEAGERVYGGGGTSFQVVADYVEGRIEVNGQKFTGQYDAVIMVTDGYAPPITPKEPGKWIWLITPDGSMWMESGEESPKMDCHRIDLPS